MSLEKVKQYFDSLGLGQRVHELAQSSATVEEAAVAVGCEPERIAKTMSFLLGEEPILIVTAGDARIDSKKYKEHFHQKAKMIPGELVEQYVGHAPGVVCRFVLPKKRLVYLVFSRRGFVLFTRLRGQVIALSSYPSKNWRIVPVAGSGLTCVRIGLRNKSTGFAPMRDG